MILLYSFKSRTSLYFKLELLSEHNVTVNLEEIARNVTAAAINPPP